MNTVTAKLYILPQLASVKAIVASLVICCLVVETIDTCKYSRGITYTMMCLLRTSNMLDAGRKTIQIMISMPQL